MKKFARTPINILTLLGVFLIAPASQAQNKVILIEEAIEGAKFKSYHLSPAGYGYASVSDCLACTYAKERRLSIDPDTEIIVGGLATSVNQFDFDGEGFTMVFYKDDAKLITRIRRSSN
jgi:hypothetical protein